MSTGTHSAPGFALQDICDTVNLGLMIVDQDMRIIVWNRWLVERAQIAEADAIGRTLGTLTPEPVAPAFIAGVKQALRYGLPVLMSNALHSAPLPLYRGSAKDLRNRIDQSIVISPINTESGERCCMIQVMDASRAVKRENILRAYSKKLRYDATTDSLTGIANRRSFDEHGEIMLAQARKRRTALSIFMIDIDFFKQYNDHYGHAAGDVTLKAVANVLNAQVLRSTDLIARYGGEEFIVAMTGLDDEQIGQFAEKICLAVIQCKLPHAQSKVAEHVTISVGVSSTVPDIATEMKLLIERADLALYEAKRKGRNQIVVSAAGS